MFSLIQIFVVAISFPWPSCFNFFSCSLRVVLVPLFMSIHYNKGRLESSTVINIAWFFSGAILRGWCFKKILDSLWQERKIKGTISGLGYSGSLEEKFLCAIGLAKMFILGNCGSCFCTSIRCFCCCQEIQQCTTWWETHENWDGRFEAGYPCCHHHSSNFQWHFGKSRWCFHKVHLFSLLPSSNVDSFCIISLIL